MMLQDIYVKSLELHQEGEPEYFKQWLAVRNQVMHMDLSSQQNIAVLDRIATALQQVPVDMHSIEPLASRLTKPEESTDSAKNLLTSEIDHVTSLFNNKTLRNRGNVMHIYNTRSQGNHTMHLGETAVWSFLGSVLLLRERTWGLVGRRLSMPQRQQLGKAFQDWHAKLAKVRN